MQKRKAIMMVLFSMLLIENIVSAGFGEIGGQLNFTVYPNSTQTLQWGLINDYANETLHMTIQPPIITPNNNFSATQTPNITFSLMAKNLTPHSVTYVGVTVTANGLKIGQSWHGMFQAVTAPLEVISGGASLQIATFKVFHINVVVPTTTTSTSSTSTSTTSIPPVIKPFQVPWLIVVIVLVLIIVIAAIIYYLTRRKRVKAVKIRAKKKRAS